MPLLPARLLAPAALLAALVFCFLNPLRAELAWTPQDGWRIEGGALSGLTGADGRNALDLMNKARQHEENGRLRSAARAYERVGKRYQHSIYAPEAYYRAAKVRLAQQKYNRAFENFQQVLSRYPNTARFNEIVGEQYRIASALLDGARGRFFGLPTFTSRDKGIEYFEYILFNAPYSDYAPLALMNIARGHQRLKNTPEAIDALDRMINTYPQSLLAPDAYLKLAQTHASLVEGPHYDQASTRDAVTYFEDFMILFPNDPSIVAAERGMNDMKEILAESRIKMGDFYFYKRDNYTAARVMYNEAITAFPDSPVAERAKKRLAEVESKAEKQASEGDQSRRKLFGLF